MRSIVKVPKDIFDIVNSNNNLGIYIHYPFCIRECFYCDFYKTTNFEKSFYDSLIKDIVDSVEFYKSIGYIFPFVGSIYFGGGTPNLMAINFIEKVLSTIYDLFSVYSNIELTMELNPDSVDPNYLKNLKSLGFNRISIGVQSFNIFALRIMGRTYSISDIFRTIGFVEKYFENYNIDLLALYPYQTIDSLKNDLKNVLSIKPNHISYYLIDIDKGTRYNPILLGKIREQYDYGESYYRIICDYLTKFYDHYEVSNFALGNFYSKHNIKYWYYYDYLGFGPSAVSKITLNNTVIRRQKKFNNFYHSDFCDEYIDFKTELTERIMLGLRTKWGIIFQDYHLKDYHLKLDSFENYNCKILKIIEDLLDDF